METITKERIEKSFGRSKLKMEIVNSIFGDLSELPYTEFYRLMAKEVLSEDFALECIRYYGAVEETIVFDDLTTTNDRGFYYPGNIVVNGDVSIKRSLIAGGDITVKGDINAGGKIVAPNGGISAASICAESTIDAKRDITATCGDITGGSMQSHFGKIYAAGSISGVGIYASSTIDSGCDIESKGNIGCHSIEAKRNIRSGMSIFSRCYIVADNVYAGEKIACVEKIKALSVSAGNSTKFIRRPYKDDRIWSKNRPNIVGKGRWTGKHYRFGQYS